MTTCRKLRELLDVTQKEMADYLSVTRPLLSLHELGRRPLPLHASVKLDAIARHLSTSASPHVAAEIQRQSIAARGMLDVQAQNYTRLAETAGIKLEAMKIQHQQYLRIFQAASGLLEESSRRTGSEKDRLWLEVLQMNVQKKMKGCGIEMQTLLRLDIQVFTRQAQEARTIKI